jgi:Methylase involved in ubiquinone/menaquinone biosynthesis
MLIRSPAFSERLNRFCELMLKKPLLRRTLKHVHELHERYGDEYVELAEKILEKSELLAWDASNILSRVFLECLQEMSDFLETGEFGHTFEETQKTVYENRDYMENEYLPGLFIAYAFTPLMYPKYPFFRNNFLSQLNKSSRGVEIGFGDGFYLWVTKQQIPEICVSGYDISPSAINVTTRVLQSSGIYDVPLFMGNILDGISQKDASFDWGVLAEVIEHIPTPEKGINEMARLICRGGLLYLSTTKDYNHPDHVTNFPSVEYVVKMIENGGFKVKETVSYRIQDHYPESPDKSVNMAFICERL